MRPLASVIPLSITCHWLVFASNLDKIIEAGQQYNSERGTLLISYPALVEGKYLPKLESISGESYDKVNIESGGGTAEVVTSLGEKVKKEY